MSAPGHAALTGQQLLDGVHDRDAVSGREVRPRRGWECGQRPQPWIARANRMTHIVIAPRPGPA
jgi:hypothetical protein